MKKYPINSKVRIVNYGLLRYYEKGTKHPKGIPPYNTDDNGACYDMLPELIGREGQVIGYYRSALGEQAYKVNIPGSNRDIFFWDQLKMISNMKTNQDVTMEFKRYGEITIPKGTRLTHETANGYDINYHFVNEFAWIDENYPEIANIMTHDAIYYGINIPKEFVDYEQES